MLLLLLNKMADISLIQDVLVDMNDEGVYEQGDCLTGSPTDDEFLLPLCRIQKYAQSGNVYERQMVARIVQELFRTAPPDALTADLAAIMNIIKNLAEGDETMVRADLLEQIPLIASQAIENSNRIECLKNVIGEYLLPLVVRNLGSSDNTVDKAAHSTLIHLMEQGLITRLQAEIQICPAILALSNEDQSAEINTGAITLISQPALMSATTSNTQQIITTIMEQQLLIIIRFVMYACALQLDVKWNLTHITASFDERKSIYPILLTTIHTRYLANYYLMSKIAPHLGRDIIERVFLSRFSELCSTCMFYIRKVCASQIGNFCAVVGKERFEKVLLPCYLSLCQDSIWGVRQSCAEVIMFVSSVCPSDLRKTQLAPAFAKLLQDECRWVQMSAYQHLGPFIATFADPSITNIAYNNRGELVFVNNNDGSEFSIDSSVREVRFYKISSNQQLQSTTLPPPPTITTTTTTLDNNLDRDEFDFESLCVNNEGKLEYDDNIINNSNSNDDCVNTEEIKNICHGNKQTDEDIKEIVESVKNAVLNYRPVEQQETGTIGDVAISRNNLKSNGNNNVIVVDNCKDELRDIEICDKTNLNNIDNNETNFNIINNKDNNGNSSVTTETTSTTTANNNYQQVINSSESEIMEDKDNLHLYNSYNYWYISPEMPLDFSIIEEEKQSSSKLDDTTLTTITNPIVAATTTMVVGLEDLYATMTLNDTTFDEVIPYNDENTIEEPSSSSLIVQQDIVPEILIKHFILMADAKFSSSIDTEMPYHCAYSLPAVALTLKDKNWPLLKDTIERLSCDLQYKVRKTVASCLHELAEMLGKDIATEYLTPIFDGFIKDLDEVRIGILKHLAHFLSLIDDEKRLTYLPRLQEFLKTENESNWRFRYELAVQVRLIITSFNPVDVAKHVILIAEALLYDVSAVREAAIALITELLRHITTKPGLNTLYLVRLVEKFALSKKWKRRQTFALLCWKLLECEALPPEQFATDIMPHLLDLSWDPVANVRLIVAKTIAQHIIPNKYFSDPNNQHLVDSLGTVIRRLQADRDRDVRQFAKLGRTSSALSSPPSSLSSSPTTTTASTTFLYCT